MTGLATFLRADRAMLSRVSLFQKIFLREKTRKASGHAGLSKSINHLTVNGSASSDTGSLGDGLPVGGDV